MEIVGHMDYQTMANIYTHLSNETLKKASVNMEDIFERKAHVKPPKGSKEARSRKPPVDMTLPWATHV